MSVPTRRQEHGIKAMVITLTVPGMMRARLGREARAQGVSISRHVVNLITLAWSVQGALSAASEDRKEELA